VYRTPNAQKIRATIEKWVCIYLRSFCTTKEKIIRIKNYQYKNGRNGDCDTNTDTDTDSVSSVNQGPY
jgi:hypothetical protein